MSEKTSFKKDYAKGSIGVRIFLRRIVKNQKYDTPPMCDKEKYDILHCGTRYEIKATYKDDGMICVEEWYDFTKAKKGWIVTSESDYIVFVSTETENMVIYPTQLLRGWYKKNYQWIKKDYALIKNKASLGIYGDIWTGAYRKIPMDIIGIQPIVMIS